MNTYINRVDFERENAKTLEEMRFGRIVIKIYRPELVVDFWQRLKDHL